MKLGMEIPYTEGFKGATDKVVAYEKAGLDVAWVPEAYGFDAVSALGYLAARTERLTVASGILNVFTRTPTLLAMTAAGIDSLSDGRFILGLGASGPQVVEGFHGVRYDAPLGRTREIVEICHKVWRRERLVHEGRHYEMPLDPAKGTGLGKPLKMITTPERERIPIWLAALGPKNVRMVAEVAEGWLPLLFLPERAGRVWGSELAAGAAVRDPELAPLQIAAGGLLAIGDDAAASLELARPMIALYVGGMGARGANFYNDLMVRYGFEAEAAEIQDLYLDGKRAEAAAKVPEEFLRLSNLCGSEGFVRERIAAFAEAGVTVLNVNPVGDDPVGLIEKVRGWLP